MNYLYIYQLILFIVIFNAYFCQILGPDPSKGKTKVGHYTIVLALNPLTLEIIQNVDENSNIKHYCARKWYKHEYGCGISNVLFMPIRLDNGTYVDALIRCSCNKDHINRYEFIQYYFKTFPRTLYSANKDASETRCWDEAGISIRELYTPVYPCTVYYHYQYNTKSKNEAVLKISGPMLYNRYVQVNNTNAMFENFTLLLEKMPQCNLISKDKSDICNYVVNYKDEFLNVFYFCCCNQNLELCRFKYGRKDLCLFGTVNKIGEVLNITNNTFLKYGKNCKLTVKLDIKMKTYEISMDSTDDEFPGNLNSDNCSVEISNNNNIKYTCYCNNNDTDDQNDEIPCNAKILERIQFKDLKSDGTFIQRCSNFALTGLLDDSRCYLYFDLANNKSLPHLYPEIVKKYSRDDDFGSNYKEFIADNSTIMYFYANYTELNKSVVDNEPQLLVIYSCHSNNTETNIQCDKEFNNEIVSNFIEKNPLSCKSFNFTATRDNVYQGTVYDDIQDSPIDHFDSFICVVVIEKNDEIYNIVGGNYNILESFDNTIDIENCKKHVRYMTKVHLRKKKLIHCYHNYDEFSMTKVDKVDDIKQNPLIKEFISKWNQSIINYLRKKPTTLHCDYIGKKKHEECEDIRKGCFGAGAININQNYEYSGCTDKIENHLEYNLSNHDYTSIQAGLMCNEIEVDESEEKCFVSYFERKIKVVCCCREKSNYNPSGLNIQCDIAKHFIRIGKKVEQYI